MLAMLSMRAVWEFVMSDKEEEMERKTNVEKDLGKMIKKIEIQQDEKEELIAKLRREELNIQHKYDESTKQREAQELTLITVNKTSYNQKVKVRIH